MTKPSPALPGKAAPKNPAIDETATFVEDKRQTARHEHTNHFTNRQPNDKK